MKQLMRLLLLLFSVILLFFGLAPMLFGIFHTGVWIMAGTGGLLLVALWNPQIKWLRWLTGLTLAGFIGIGGALSIAMLSAMATEPDATSVTVIVLGSQIIGDQPSKMLRSRLDTAIDYWKTHPDVPIVCAGGRSENHIYSEAYVMRQYLINQGIPQVQIYAEDRSRNTQENLQFSAQIITDYKLSPSVAIATDGFHQLRAAVYARNNKLRAGALPSSTPWGLLPSYWVREWFGLCKAIFLETK